NIVNIRHVTQHFVGNMIRRLVFGKRYFNDLPPSSSSGPGHDEVAHLCVSDYFPALIGLDLDGHEKVSKDAMQTINRLHDPIIEERIRERSSTLEKCDEKKEARDFLDVLVHLKDAEGQPLLSLQDIRAQTAIMKKATEELDIVVGKDRLVEESDIPRLNYLKSCIREAFRIHPYHALNVPHVAMADTT
ncbi:hypothetical protein ZWY2020_034439, partial [Hordeum vulgare]